MKKNFQELIAVGITIFILIGLPIIVFQNGPWLNKGNTRVIYLTAVMENGAWTTESVNGLNYWWKKFQPAEITLHKGENVLLRLSSSDVAHTFYVPELKLGPILVEAGHTVEVNLNPNTAGDYTYYCVTVCGECHYFMQGTIKILDGEEKKIASYINENTITSEPYCEIHSSSMNFSSFIERGEYLYKRKGCISCHGNNGKGGVYNPNYVNKFIPRLDELADKMKIYSKDDADTMIKLLESKVDLESLEDNPPIENYTRILAQYNSVCNKILDGSSSLQKLDTDGPKPPLDMPAWEGQLSEEDINQIIAYLITQYPWEKYE